MPAGSCRLSATGIRFWVILCPLRSWPFLTVGLPATTCTQPDLNGVATFHTHEIRPGWAPPIPRQRRCSYGRNTISRPPPAAFQRRGCYHPTGPSHPRGSGLRGIKQGFTPFARPVFPSPVAPGMERGPLGLNPELRTPPLPATHVRTGTGHGTLARSYTLDMIVDLQSVNSLVMCDLVSHRYPRLQGGSPSFCGAHDRGKAAPISRP